MTIKIKQALIGGIVATVIMTLFTMMAPMMGMPKMNIPQMLSMMMGFPIAVGWIMHFMIGIIFAMSYAFFFINVVKGISSNVLKGAIFGMAAFVFAQIMMVIMGAMMGGAPPMEGSMVLTMFGSIMGHVIFGITVALFVKS
ncbi:MAG: hypothetical protein IPL46_04590 [Saprospiraceae bacterium]|nr:hypothetical protein [Saprospiraceae bacterium]